MPGFTLILCFVFSKCSAKFSLSFHPFFFSHINHEKLDYTVQEIKELTPGVFYPTQLPVCWLAPNI